MQGEQWWLNMATNEEKQPTQSYTLTGHELKKRRAVWVGVWVWVWVFNRQFPTEYI